MSEENNPGQSHLLNVGNRIIQGLWIGPQLSIMEQLSIASFLRNGHDYHLYIYNELPNVPKGVVIRDASEILPASAWSVCQARKPDQLAWGETGPGLIAEVVRKYRLDKYQKPYYIFCPISDWHKFLEPYVVAVHPHAYAVHLWNEAWRLANQDKN